MEYRPLGRTGIRVSELCLGAMMLNAGGNPDHEDGARIVHRALDAGVNFVDTADAYAAGESEEIVGKALEGRRDDVVLATKVGLPFDDDPNHRGTSRRWIRRAVEGSLRRLRTDHIDLYQVHRLDPHTGLDETLGALSELVREGKVRAIGVSNASGAELVEAHWLAERRGHERFATDQPAYSMLTRAIEYDVLPTAERHGMGVLTYRPIEAGWLSGRFRKGRPVEPSGSPARRARFADQLDPENPANAAKLDAVEQLALLAEDAGLTLVQLAVAFAVRHPAVTSTIIGPRTIEHLDGYLAADGVVLSDDVLDRIDEIVPPGHTVNVGDNMWHTSTTALEAASRRRPAP
jgi:aryl-alcohol dehydrogenase-like predicted oxidoreductase